MTENESNKPEPTQANEADANAPSNAEAANAATAGVEPNAALDAAADESDEGDEGDEGEEGEASSEAGSAEGEPAKKKKRRRRRKKKGAPGESGAEGQPAAAQAKPAAHAPLGRWFDAHPKKHAFTAGEIVAGVVTRVEDGAVLIDLFGKALAVADVLEPREIEALPEPAPETTVAVAAVEATPEGTSSGTVPAETADAEEHAAALAVEAEAEAAEQAAEAAHEAGAAEEPEEDAVDEAAAPSIEAVAVEPPVLGEVYRGRIASVAESGHVAIINRRIDRPKAKAALKQAQEARRRVQGVVFGFNRGGFDVIVGGIRAFCPASGMSLDMIEDPSAFVGRKLEFTVPPSKGGKSIVVSRRTILERDLRKQARDRMKALKIGQRMNGRVTEVRDYGLLVDIGEGLEGLVHLSEVSWSRGVRPQDAAKRGDEVQVEVLRVQPATRKDRYGRISLSIRACLQDPWDANAAILKEGHAQKGKVVRTAEFGAFIELAPGVEGMLHISELGKNLAHANQVLSDGQEIPVLVERVDRGQRRISLSRLTGADAEALESGSLELGSSRAPKPGQIVTVVVEKVEHHGLLVHVEGVPGRRGRGYIPNRELGDQSGESKQGGGGGGRRQAPIGPGSKLEVKVVGTDRDGGLRCSVKARVIDEERSAVREYRKEVSQKGFGTFGDLLRAKLNK